MLDSFIKMAAYLADAGIINRVEIFLPSKSENYDADRKKPKRLRKSGKVRAKNRSGKKMRK